MYGEEVPHKLRYDKTGRINCTDDDNSSTGTEPTTVLRDAVIPLRSSIIKLNMASENVEISQEFDSGFRFRLFWESLQCFINSDFPRILKS